MNLRRSLNVVVITAIMGMVCTSVNGQMAAAKPIPPALIKGVSLEAPAKEVWDFVSEPKNFDAYVSGVNDFVCNGEGQGSKMSFSLVNDKNRKQELSVLNKDERTIGFFITQSAYPSEKWFYRMIVGTDEEGSFVQFEAVYIIDDKAQKKIMNDKVLSEWLLIKKGLEAKFNEQTK